MLQLALETTGKDGSIAILDDETLLWHRRLGIQRRTAAELAPHLEQALAWCEERSARLDVISVAVGPGSFTGLRIAVTTAKTLGYALQLPIIPVGSLAAIAATVPPDDQTSQILVGLNAYRQQVFAAEFSREELLDPQKILACNHRAEVLSRDDWDRRVAELIGHPAWALAGDPSIYSAQHADQLMVGDEPEAAGVGRVGLRLARRGNTPRDEVFTRPIDLAIRYLKPSAAEEKATAH